MRSCFERALEACQRVRSAAQGKQRIAAIEQSLEQIRSCREHLVVARNRFVMTAQFRQSVAAIVPGFNHGGIDGKGGVETS